MKKITFILACLICTLCFGVLAGCHGKEANTGQEDTANVADTAYANSIDSATMAKITQCNDPINELRTRVEKAESQLGSLNNRLVYIMAMSAVGVVALIIAVFLLLKRVKNRDLRSLDCEIKKLKERVPYLESSSKENNIGRKKDYCRPEGNVKTPSNDSSKIVLQKINTTNNQMPLQHSKKVERQIYGYVGLPLGDGVFVDYKDHITSESVFKVTTSGDKIEFEPIDLDKIINFNGLEKAIKSRGCERKEARKINLIRRGVLIDSEGHYTIIMPSEVEFIK